MANHTIPKWIYSCLDQYSNCACGRAIVVKMGKDHLLAELENAGYPCDLEIRSDNKDPNPMPKDGTYILTLKDRPKDNIEEDIEDGLEE